MRKIGIVALCILVYSISYNMGQTAGRKESKDTIIVERIDTLYNIGDTLYSNLDVVLSGNPQENLYEALLFYNVKYPDVAYAIAAQETGWFKSDLCIKHNNLFGLYDSENKKYYHFKTWTESIIAYKNWIENKYEGNTEYLKYLEKLPYSEDKHYIGKIQTLITQIKEID